MNENEKDWDNPIVPKIYAALVMADREDPEVCDWLNANGFCNLTYCPSCHVDDFTHVEGCLMAKAIDAIAGVIERQRPKFNAEIEREAQKLRRQEIGYGPGWLTNHNKPL